MSILNIDTNQTDDMASAHTAFQKAVKKIAKYMSDRSSGLFDGVDDKIYFRQYVYHGAVVRIIYTFNNYNYPDTHFNITIRYNDNDTESYIKDIYETFDRLKRKITINNREITLLDIKYLQCCGLKFEIYNKKQHRRNT